jgi:hypothetical protein
MSMVQLQITLTDEENTAVRLEALRRRISVDDVIRERIRPLVDDAPGDPEDDPFYKLIGAFSSDPDEPNAPPPVEHATASSEAETPDDDPFAKILAFSVGEPGDPDDVSVNHDYYLYGGKRKA